jgi:hypothetical protein
MVDMEKAKKDKVLSTHVKTKFKKWLFLRIDIREDCSSFVRFIPEYLLVHEYFVCVFLVIFYKNGIMQIVPILLMKVFIIGILLKKPFTEWLDQWMITVNEIFFSLIMVGMILMTSANLDAETRHKTIGMGMIILYLLLMIFNTVLAFISCY